MSIAPLQGSRTFSCEPCSGTFHSLGVLPKRKHDKNYPIYHFIQSDDDENFGSLDERPQLSNLNIPLLRPGPQSLPSLPHTCASPPRPSTAPPQLASKGAVSPILLSNGKPLKPSLKPSRSMSMPHQRHHDHHHKHSRANSEPSTPVSTPKTVHFPEEDHGLATVHIYNRSSCPDALSNPHDGNADEIDAGDGNSQATLARFPFPSCNPVFNYGIDSTKSSPTPCKFSPDINILLESLGLVPSPSPSPSPNVVAKPFLAGSVLVRNLAFEKQVSVRFTLDGWQTISEVIAHYAESLPCLPTRIRSLVRGPSQDESTLQRGKGWDRFTFIIHLEDYAYPLSSRTLWLASRYSIGSTYPEPGSAQYGPGGEFWDNNNGTNYRVEFKPAVAASPSSQSRPRCETVPAPISSRRIQPQPTAHKDVLSTMVQSFSDSETRPVRQIERRSALSFYGARKPNLCNYVPPGVRVTSSVPVPSAGFPPSSPDEDNPSPVSSTLSTPSISPTIAPRVIIHEQLAISTCLSDEPGKEDDEFTGRFSGHVPDWEWSTPNRPRTEGLPDPYVDISPVQVLPVVNGINDNNSLLDAFVKRWCFAQDPSPTHHDGGVMA